MCTIPEVIGAYAEFKKGQSYKASQILKNLFDVATHDQTKRPDRCSQRELEEIRAGIEKHGAFNYSLLLEEDLIEAELKRVDDSEELAMDW